MVLRVPQSNHSTTQINNFCSHREHCVTRVRKNQNFLFRTPNRVDVFILQAEANMWKERQNVPPSTVHFLTHYPHLYYPHPRKTSCSLFLKNLFIPQVWVQGHLFPEDMSDHLNLHFPSLKYWMCVHNRSLSCTWFYVIFVSYVWAGLSNGILCCYKT